MEAPGRVWPEKVQSARKKEEVSAVVPLPSASIDLSFASLNGYTLKYFTSGLNTP